CVEQDDKGWDARKRAYCLKTQPATGETYPKSDLFNKAICPTYFCQGSLPQALGRNWLFINNKKQ
ncbi:hypothetical protein ACWJTJ_20945, partial [Klebsiella pneumoniae]